MKSSLDIPSPSASLRKKLFTLCLISLMVYSLGQNFPISFKMPSYISLFVSRSFLSKSYFLKVQSMASLEAFIESPRARRVEINNAFIIKLHMGMNDNRRYEYSGDNSKQQTNYSKVEMAQSLSKPVLDPYKTIGCFVHGPVAVSQTQPFSIAAGCYNSFKIYSDELAIKMVSPCFKGPVRALHIHNQFTYVLVGAQLIKIRYHHVVQKWELPLKTQTSVSSKHKIKQLASLLVFDGLVIVGIGYSIYMVPELNKQQQIEGKKFQIEHMNLGLNIIEIVHPVTYINKIMVYGHDKILLVNPISQKILFEYSTVTKPMIDANKKIVLVCPSPIIDIVAVCLDSGQILILNIRASKIIFTMKQKKTVTALTFSNTGSLMASADEAGNIILWDLENKNILYRLEAAFIQPIDHLSFVPGFSLLTAASSKSNSIKQFRINLDDSKTLSQFRERTGCPAHSPIVTVKCQNDKEITFSTKSNTVFSSLYSHSNMYQLPSCLDSSLPYHLVAKNFTIQVYRERTIIGKLNVHQNIEIGAFSLSNKYVIIGTKSKLIKVAIPGGVNPSTILHVSCEWKVSDPSQIILCKEHFIYVVCFDSIHILNFNEPTLVQSINAGQNCYHSISNSNQTLMALQNRTKQTIEIWDMRSITLSRQFKSSKNEQTCTKLCFTSDNRYLLSAHSNHQLVIWSILQSNLYKVVSLEARIADMCFTPDNAYFLTIFEGAKEINIWHNYIGKITSAQNEDEVYQFQTSLNYLCPDYRQKLNAHRQVDYSETTLQQSELDALLDQIEDAPSNLTYQYDFTKASKWMPLVYYDQIKNRNSISKGDEIPSLPFFLDFKNLSDEQAKVNKQMKQEVQDKRKLQRSKVDSQLSNDQHEISIGEGSTGKQFEATWRILSSLSVAEVDYQLRKFLILPGNCQHLVRMFAHILASKKCANLMTLNIVLARALEIAGTELCQLDYKEQAKQLQSQISHLIESQESIVQRCIAVASQSI